MVKSILARSFGKTKGDYMRLINLNNSAITAEDVPVVAMTDEFSSSHFGSIKVRSIKVNSVTA